MSGFAKDNDSASSSSKFGTGIWEGAGTGLPWKEGEIGGEIFGKLGARRGGLNEGIPCDV